jgi:DtxR family Mn-dependent transcriptional regulator
MPSLTVENYLKAILQLGSSAHRGSKAAVSTGELARSLGVAPGTATAMVKSLEAEGLVRYRPYAGVALNARGRKLALHVLRRHRLVELFLVKTLGMSRSAVHEEAEDLEHAISERLLEHLDRFLGHPSFDPHGDPIPAAGGELPAHEPEPLVGLAVGQSGSIRRLLDQSPAFLEMAETHHLLPGTRITVLRRDEARDILELRAEAPPAASAAPVSLSFAAAAQIDLSPAPLAPSRAKPRRRARPRRSALARPRARAQKPRQ